MVVDDDPQLRQSLQWALEDEGFAVETASDGVEAIAQAATQAPDLVILDMTLPGGDGFQVAAALQAAPGMAPPIVMITADGHAAEKASRIGAFGYLRKPFDIADLLSMIHQGLASR
jgi:DNA-binding response OmpR family regulator